MKVALIEKENNGLSQTISSFFKFRKDIIITNHTNTTEKLYKENDFIIFLDCKETLPEESNAKIIQTHASLLPAFDTETPIKDAFLASVKVSGITVSYADEKIIAQFPVLIDYNTDFEDFEANIRKTEKMLYPIVLKSVFDNKPFSFSDIMGNSQHEGCSGNCGSCGGCH